jgi:hypothetical protein
MKVENTDNSIPATDIESAVHALAKAKGVGVDEFLAQVDKRIDERMAEALSPCLLPDDLIDYQTFGTLSPSLEQHRKECAFCDQLLAASTPSPMKVQEMRERVASLAGARSLRNTTTGWGNWRIPVAAMTMATIVSVAFLSRSPAGRVENASEASILRTSPLVSRTYDDGPILAVLTQTKSGGPAPVTIRLRTLTGSSITVTDKAVEVAASTAAIAKHPPNFTVPPYAATDKTGDTSQQEATEKTIAIVAKIAPEWESSTLDSQGQARDHQVILQEAVAQVPGVQLQGLDEKTGLVHLLFLGHDGISVSTSFYLTPIVKTANQYNTVIEAKWLNENVSDVKPIRLDHQISIQIVAAPQHSE